jgi:hypothetical protein
MMSVFPFIDDGLELRDVEDLLIETGLGKPSYYEWRSRSGCYFCFYQRKQEWLGLHDRHPDLFEAAVAYEQKRGYEKSASEAGYTWSQGESLPKLLSRKNAVRSTLSNRQSSSLLLDIFNEDQVEEDFCSACHL